jgi:hypothetical protein
VGTRKRGVHAFAKGNPSVGDQMRRVMCLPRAMLALHELEIAVVERICVVRSAKVGVDVTCLGFRW